VTPSGPPIEKVREEISREIERVQEESYGAPVNNVRVLLGDDVVTVVMDVVWSRAEETLVEAGQGDAVRTTREAFQEAIAPTFTAIVERATGRRVQSFASRMIVGPEPWAAEVFRLGPRSEP
jgi:uncharacterized protein YbcI